MKGVLFFMCSIICTETKKIVDWAVDRARRFDVFDFAVMKFTILALGVLIGSRFAAPLKKFQKILWILFGASSLYLIYRLIFDEE